MGHSRAVARQVARLRRRDGDDCWLCREPIDFGIEDDDDDWHWSRDHFIPRSLGGPNTTENMRLAHKWCNSHRGTGGRAFPSLGLLRAWAEGRPRP